MTTEEVEDVVRALTAIAEKLEASSAKQSIKEAFLQVHAYADEHLPSQVKDRSGDAGRNHPSQ
jgi:hypothetical protein